MIFPSHRGNHLSTGINCFYQPLVINNKQGSYMLPINLLKTWLEIAHMNSQTYDEAREVVMDKILTYFHSQRHAELYVYQYENQSE